jgi:hypothetical protein
MNPDLGSILVGQRAATTLVVSKVPIQVAKYPAADTAGRVDRGANDTLSWLSTRICAAFLLALGIDRDVRPLLISPNGGCAVLCLDQLALFLSR